MSIETIDAPTASPDADAEQPAGAEESYPYPPPLTVADGFRFGCGMILAGVAFAFLGIILVAALLLLAMVAGFPLPFGIR